MQSGQKGAGPLPIVGVIALVLVVAAVGAWRMGWLPTGSSSEEATLATTPEPSTGAPATPGSAPAADAGVSIDAIAEEPGGSSVTTAKKAPPAPGSTITPTRLASSGTGNASAVSAVTPDAPRRTQLAQLDEHVTYQYNAIGRRDPFQSLLSGAFVGDDVGGDAPPDPGGMKIVGIVWGASDQFAMVEDVRGNSYVLRKGDKLQNGYVEALRRDAVVVNVTADGQSQQVVIPFVRKGDANVR